MLSGQASGRLFYAEAYSQFKPTLNILKQCHVMGYFQRFAFSSHLKEDAFGQEKKITELLYLAMNQIEEIKGKASKNQTHLNEQPTKHVISNCHSLVIAIDGLDYSDRLASKEKDRKQTLFEPSVNQLTARL